MSCGRGPSVWVVAASASAAIAATIAVFSLAWFQEATALLDIPSTAGHVASWRAVAAASTHRRAIAVATATAAHWGRTAATASASARHTRQVGALRHDLNVSSASALHETGPSMSPALTLIFLPLKTLSLSTSAWVTRFGSENSTYA